MVDPADELPRGDRQRMERATAQPHATSRVTNGLEPVAGQQGHSQRERPLDTQTPRADALVFGHPDPVAALGGDEQRRFRGHLPVRSVRPVVAVGRIVGEHGGHQDVGEQVVVARGMLMRMSASTGS